MLFGNLLFAIALTVVWPLWLLGLLAACAWLERRTLIPEEVVPRQIRRMDGSTPEAVEAMVFQETGAAVSANGQGPPATIARLSAEQPGWPAGGHSGAATSAADGRARSPAPQPADGAAGFPRGSGASPWCG
jgi:hypothetical protein